jgi:hypothetical protein
MTHIATSSLRLVRSFVMLCILAAQSGCSTFHPVNGAPKPAETVSERSDAEMRPDHLLSECKKLKSGGSYRLSDGPQDKEVMFYLDRNNTGESIRKLKELMSSFEFTLNEKHSHVAVEPEPGSSSLWMNLSPAGGGSELHLILNGTSIITSDKVSDWHWSGGSQVMYTKVIEALAPTEAERHVERVAAGAGTVDEPPIKVPQ